MMVTEPITRMEQVFDFLKEVEQTILEVKNQNSTTTL